MHLFKKWNCCTFFRVCVCIKEVQVSIFYMAINLLGNKDWLQQSYFGKTRLVITKFPVGQWLGVICKWWKFVKKIVKYIILFFEAHCKKAYSMKYTIIKIVFFSMKYTIIKLSSIHKKSFMVMLIWKKYSSE